MSNGRGFTCEELKKLTSSVEGLTQFYDVDTQVVAEVLGKPSLDEALKVWRDKISEYKCGYGTQAMIWLRLRDRTDLPAKELGDMLLRIHPTIATEIADRLTAPEYLAALENYQLIHVFDSASQERRDHAGNALLGRDNVHISELLTYRARPREFVLKASSLLERSAERYPAGIASDVNEVLKHVFYKMDDKRKKEFAIEVAGTLNAIIRKYLVD